MEETLDFNEINASTSGERSIEDVLKNGYSFTIGEAFSLGFNIFKQYLGAFVAYTFLQGLISLIVGIIPFFGFLINLAISPALHAGFYIVAHRIHKNEWYDFPSFFDGFKAKFTDLLLNGLIMVGLALIIALPLVFIIFLSFGAAIFTSTDSLFSSGFLIASVMAIFVFAFLSSLLALNTPLLLFKDTGPWNSMATSAKIVLKNYFMILGLLFVLLLLNIAGAMVLFIGLLFTIPLSVCIVYATYVLIFKEQRAGI